MPSLQIRDLPETVYRKLVDSAKRDHRTISQQATVLLERALETAPSARARRLALLENLAANPLVKTFEGIPTPEALVREDRDR